MYKSHLITPKSIFIAFDDGKVVLGSDSPKFQEIKSLLLARHFSDSRIMRLLNKDRLLKAKTKKIFEYKGGKCYFKNELIPDAISKMVLDFEDNQLPYEPILKFWIRLQKNPSKDSRDELMLFVQHNNICITDDGYMVLYKRVDYNFKDCHTHTFDNSPGKTVSMPRNKVNANRYETCSDGLHVCSWSYLGSFGGDRIVECLVDPVDVVSIPNDYNNSKMRCCKYQVIREITTEGEPIVEIESKSEDSKPVKDKKRNTMVETKENPRQQRIYDILKVRAGSKGRILIPASFIQKLKKNAVYAYIRIENKKIFIGSKKTTLAYKIDEHYNIRVSSSLLKEAGLDKNKNFVLEFNGTEIELKGAK